MTFELTHRRRLATAFALCSLAGLVLLGGHPASGAGQAFADLLRAEASSRVTDGLVHGGFIAVSSVLIVSFVYLSHLLGPLRVGVVAALVAFCAGSIALSGSMTLDGLVIPALAERFVGTGTGAEDLAVARTLFIFCGTAIRVLMPMGLLFEVLAVLCWSVSLMAQGWRRVGGLGIASAVIYVAAMLALPGKGPLMLMAGIVLLCLWYFVLAGILWARDGWSSPAPAHVGAGVG